MNKIIFFLIPFTFIHALGASLSNVNRSQESKRNRAWLLFEE